ncbi:MAG: hypothetical protein GTN70_02495 [Deltaproteobacteria bacterium]|nr:hypothetical protein [Deltaproteobacteria bacterium]NIS76513.1 hypothetical protein [Deltaproteobacteria bacterium]
MKKDIVLGEIKDLLEALAEKADKAKDLLGGDKLKDPDLLDLLGKIGSRAKDDSVRMGDFQGEGIATYDVVKFLNTMLKVEYQGIFDYNLHAENIHDEYLRERFRKFGATEIEHARMLCQLIRKLGGTPKPSSGHLRRQTPTTIKEMIERHLEGEKKAIELCEKGLNVFTSPELTWALGTIRLDEIDHSRELNAIYDQYRLSTDIVEINKKYVPPKDIDFDSDEPWVE